MRNNKAFLAAAPIVILLAVLGFAVVRSHRPVNRPLSHAASNMQNAWLQKNQIYFFTGSFFAKYNLDNFSTTRISDYLTIKSDVTSMDWSKDGVVFQGIPGGNRDDFSVAATQLGASANKPHWWRYDFNTKQYQLLSFADSSACDTVVQVQQAQFACAAPSSSNSAATDIILFSGSPATKKILTTTDDAVSDLKAASDKLYFVSTRLSGKESLNFVGIGSGDAKEIYKSEGSLKYFVSGNVGYIDEVPSSETSQSHTEVDSAEQNTKHKITYFTAGATKKVTELESANLSFYQGPDDTFYVSSSAGSIQKLQANKAKSFARPMTNPPTVPSFQFEYSQRFFAINPSNELLAFPKVDFPNGYKDPSRFNFKENSDDGSSYIDDSNKQLHDTAIFSNDIPASQQEATVGENLQARGYRPAEFRFNWLVDGGDYTAPVKPSAINLP